jgi:hypothetical protein
MHKLFQVCSLSLIAGLTGCDQVNTPAEPQAAEQPAMQAQKATAGVGKKGQSLRDNQGVAKIIAGPVAALANVEQMVTFDIQVKKALDLYRALEGSPPKSHEEFMEKIIRANRIQLPELPAGAVYHFNADKGELWVYPEDEVPSE